MCGVVSEMIQTNFDKFSDEFPQLLSGYEENEDGEEDYIEIYEYWAVSPWLAKKLEEKGERVEHDFHGLNIRGCTTTGQMICMDSVIEAIAKDFITVKV